MSDNDRTQVFYIKATLDGGVSAATFKPVIHYKLGMNKHPKPDTSATLCSAGIHLAKTVKAAKKLCNGATEFYLATPGKIYAEDGEKLRTNRCNILMKLDNKMLFLLGGIEFPGDWVVPDNPICGQEWLSEHWMDITQDDIDNQTLSVSCDRHTFTIKNKLNKKGIRKVLQRA